MTQTKEKTIREREKRATKTYPQALDGLDM